MIKFSFCKAQLHIINITDTCMGSITSNKKGKKGGQESINSYLIDTQNVGFGGLF